MRKPLLSAFALPIALSACSNGGSTSSTGSGGAGGQTTSTNTSVSTTGSTMSTTTTATSGSTSASSTATSSSTGMLQTVDISAQLVEMGTTNPVVGAKICVLEHPELACTMSDATGAFTEAIPANADTGILIDATGYESILIAVETSANPLMGAVINVPTASSTQAFYMAAATPYPNPGNGFLGVLTRLGNTKMGEAGSKLSLSPASGKGPFYADASGMESSTLSATSSYGFARFAALMPGTILVDATCNPGTTEQNFFGWPTMSASEAKVPIVAGYETEVGFGCF